MIHFTSRQIVSDLVQSFHQITLSHFKTYRINCHFCESFHFMTIHSTCVVFLVVTAAHTESNVCGFDCIGESCIVDSDCASGESFCGGTDKCATSCVGKSCTSNYDCATGECCDSDGECSSGDCGLAGWIVAVIVISILVVVVIPIGVVVFCCFCAAGAASAWRRPAHGGVIVTQPATTGTTVLATQQQQQLYTRQHNKGSRCISKTLNHILTNLRRHINLKAQFICQGQVVRQWPWHLKPTRGNEN